MAPQAMTIQPTAVNVPADASVTSAKLSGALTTPAALTVTGALTGTSATFTTADNSDNLTLTSTDADANSGPNVKLYRNSSSPADNDFLGNIKFVGRNDNSQDVQYAEQEVYILDASDGTEDGLYNVNVMTAGANTSYMQFKAGSGVVFNEDSNDIDFRVESDNSTHALFVQGSDGNVSLNHASPTAILDVRRGDASGKIAEFHTSTGFGIELGSSQSEAYIQAGSSQALLFKTNGSNERMRIDASGHITSLPTYNNGSASSANMVVNSSGVFLRSVSSAKYKKDIEDVQDAYVDSLLNIRPVYYRSTLENDNTEHSHWGFIAEEVAEIDPRLVHYKTVDITYSDDGERVETKLETPEPEGVQYDRFAPLMLKLIQKQQATIEAQATAITDLTTRLTALENN